jgi:hypothetical protein
MPKTEHLEQRVIIILPRRQTPSSSRYPYRRKPRLLTIICFVLAIVALVHFIAVTHSAYPTVTPTNCQGWLRTMDYTHVVHLQVKTQEMGAIQFVNQLVGGQPAVMVQVNSTDAQQALDVYVFGCLQQHRQFKLTTLFSQRKLPQGTVSISPDNTLITSALDTNQPAQESALEQPLQQNIYREYLWQHHTFVQVAYPSLYPVASLTEAEALQQQADNGQSLPWSDPLDTAEQMAKDLFHWPGNDPQDSILSNDGTTARVQLVQQNPSITVIVTLKRLIQQNSGGLWFVVGAQSSGISLEQPQPLQAVASPIILNGTGALADGTITTALFDHALAPLAFTNTAPTSIDSSGNFTATLSYGNIAPDQEALLLIESLPPNGSSENGQLLLAKVILANA